MVWRVGSGIEAGEEGVVLWDGFADVERLTFRFSSIVLTTHNSHLPPPTPSILKDDLLPKEQESCAVYSAMGSCGGCREDERAKVSSQ